MIIKPDASFDEYSSPFFKANEKFCSEFESFIAERNGEVKGKYNAWSYAIYGKIREPKTWTLIYKKSTFTSSGNLLLSSKSQSLLVLVEWTTRRIENSDSDFKIRKKKTTDLIKLNIGNKLKPLNISKKYVIEFGNEKPNFLKKIIEITKELFEKEEIYIIELKNGILKIELRTENHYFEIFNQLAII